MTSSISTTMTAITEHMVLTRAKVLLALACTHCAAPAVMRVFVQVAKREEVRMINFWGAGISDTAILSTLVNLEVVSLSWNAVHTLRDFAACPRLRELYLSRNRIADVSEVRWLSALPTLHILNLTENPCTKAASYRCVAIAACAHLRKLDDCDVLDDERQPGPAPQHASAGTEAATPTTLVRSESEAKLEEARHHPKKLLRPPQHPSTPDRASRESSDDSPAVRTKSSRQDRIVHAIEDLLSILDNSRIQRVAERCADLLKR